MRRQFQAVPVRQREHLDRLAVERGTGSACVTVGPFAVAGACRATEVRQRNQNHGATRSGKSHRTLPRNVVGIVSDYLRRRRSRKMLDRAWRPSSFSTSQVVRCRPGAPRRVLRGRRGRGARARRRERRRQVHPPQGARRHLQPDGGDVRWRRGAAALGSPREALEHGIGMVYQEMLSFPNLIVTGEHFRRPRDYARRTAAPRGDARADPGTARASCTCRSPPTRRRSRCRPPTGSCCRSRARWRSIAESWCSTSRRRR